MRKNSKFKIQNSKLIQPLTPNPQSPIVAFLWDESFLWGLMAYKALISADLPFELVRSEDIKNGKLENYKMLFVPGGWASNKLKSLRDTGVSEIKKFVNDGGNYLGFCGGAGLATLDGIGLLNIKRKPTRERVPSFSGRISINTNEHPIWNGITTALSSQRSAVSKKLTPNSQPLIPVFHAWWPSQFVVDNDSIKILASYGNALPDAFSSDLNVGDVEANQNWQELEKVYRINLDPKRLLNEPAVVESSYGKGKVILSLIHFDTPGDVDGQQVLRNLWAYLEGQNTEYRTQNTDIKQKIDKCSLCSDIFALCSDLISLGERNFLWFWRNPMLLQWRRGVRGLEYCTLYMMMKEIEEIICRGDSRIAPTQNITHVKQLLIPFVEKAKRLLILERHALQKGPISYERCDDPEVQKIRAELFSGSKSHGGMFKELIDEVDKLLYTLLPSSSKQQA
ncbi:MAG: hypothetical protein HZB61_01805 [Nitrospirae bacterium]|nr:hypothetical protein [Nitrospirota bacterium]